jgi:rhodanese-related sulfurtransferase
MEQHGITAEELHAVLASDQEVLLFDVRQPLDLLAYPEMIPKAQRIAPNEVLARPTLIPKEKDAVVYCTCPGEKTSRTVLRRALALGFLRIKFLKGGLAAWKAKGLSGGAVQGGLSPQPKLGPALSVILAGLLGPVQVCCCRWQRLLTVDAGLCA